MKKLVLTLAIAALSAATSFAQTATWKVDVSHSNMIFTVEHMVISEVEGSFKLFDGTITSDKADFSDAKIAFTVDINSINTDNEMRDGHLKGEDFFEAAKFPKAEFVSTSMKSVGKNKYKLTGNLTMHGVTRQETFDLVYRGTGMDPYGNTKAGFKATGKINRQNYGVKWSKTTEAGAVVSDEVQLTVNIEAAKQKK